MGDQQNIPPNPGAIPHWAESTAEQAKTFDPLQDIPGARIDLLRGAPQAAIARLGQTEPPIDPGSPNSLRGCLAWNIMHAEAAVMSGDFDTARVFCKNGLCRLQNDGVRRIGRGTISIIGEAPLLEAMLCTIAAEAERRQGRLDSETVKYLEKLVRGLSPVMYDGDMDDRFKFVIYTAARTLGLYQKAEGTIGDLQGARGWLETAAIARTLYINPTLDKRDRNPRPTPRLITPGAQLDIDKLEESETSPLYAAVMYLPYAT